MRRLHKTLALLIVMLFIASTTVFSQNNLEVSGFNFSGITNYHVFIENLTVISPNSNMTYKNTIPLNCILNLKQKEFVNIPFASVAEIGYRIDNGTSTNIPIQPSDEGWHYFTAFNETFKITIQSLMDISTLTNGAHNLTIFANGICNIDNNGITSWNSSLAPIAFNVDHLPPHISVLSPHNVTYQEANITSISLPLNFTINKPTSWIGYSLDNQTNVTINGNTTLSGLTYGNHTLVIFTNDTVGNAGVSNEIDFSVIEPISSQVSANEAIVLGSIASVIGVSIAIVLIFRRKKQG